MKGAQSLTFDSAGNLWVMNYGGAGLSTASILRFDNPAGALGLVRPDPTLTITPSASGQAAFNQGTGIAFDAAGNLWLAAVANVLRIDQAASLSGAVTAVPSTIISSGNDAYVAAAFDAAGSLWITGARNGYFVTRIDAPGSLTGAVTPSTVTRVHLPSPSAFASGMGFDADGALWIAMSDRIVKLSDPRSLSGDITPTPSVVLTKTMPDLATKLVFWPTPPGLPLYR
jgi:sugar lactone lactonase YvrE